MYIQNVSKHFKAKFVIGWLDTPIFQVADDLL